MGVVLYPSTSTNSPTSYPVQKNASPMSVGHLQCRGHEADIGICIADLDKTDCVEEAVGIDCTGTL